MIPAPIRVLLVTLPAWLAPCDGLGWAGSSICWLDVAVSPDQQWVLYRCDGRASETDGLGGTGAVLVTRVDTGDTHVLAQRVYEAYETDSLAVLRTFWGLYVKEKDRPESLPRCVFERFPGLGFIDVRDNEVLWVRFSSNERTFYFEVDNWSRGEHVVYRVVDGVTPERRPQGLPLPRTLLPPGNVAQAQGPTPAQQPDGAPWIIPPAKMDAGITAMWLDDGRVFILAEDGAAYAADLTAWTMERMERPPDHAFFGCVGTQAFPRRRCLYETGGYHADEIWLWDGSPEGPPRLLVPARPNWTPKYP